MRKRKPDIIWHYTNLDVLTKLFNNISDSKKQERIDLKDHSNTIKHFTKEHEDIEKKIAKLWSAFSFQFHASCCYNMNDITEYKFFKNVLLDCLKDYEETKGTTYSENLNTFLSKWDKEIDFTFNVSFSGAEDSLVMWRGYGLNGCGIALGFSRKELKKIFHDQLFEMEYPSQKKLQQELNSPHSELDKKSIVESIYEHLDNVDGIPYNLLSFLRDNRKKYKHPAYASEEEWKIQSKHPCVKFKSSGNRIVPYCIIPIPVHTLKRIIIGPCLEQEVNIEAIEKMLIYSDIYIKDIKKKILITPSQVPYRI